MKRTISEKLYRKKNENLPGNADRLLGAFPPQYGDVAMTLTPVENRSQRLGLDEGSGYPILENGRLLKPP